MVYLQAPWDLIQATVQLPNPSLGNLKNNETLVNIRNSMNGELYSYKKSSDRIKLSWDLLLRRDKALELETFIDYYIQYEWRVVDWNDKEYRMVLINEPFEFTKMGKGEKIDIDINLGTYRRNEFVSVKLELEGKPLA